MSVTAAEGFVASGVGAGLRPSGKPDVALLRSVPPAVGCAMWTLNRVQAAPVWSRGVMSSSRSRRPWS